MISFRLDASSGVPAYLQLVQQVEHALRAGRLGPGDQLPLVREVVAELSLNPNTVLKAYRLLEAQGLTEGRPGLGTFVSERPRVATVPSYAALSRRLSAWISAARAEGLDDQEIRSLFASALHEAGAA